MLKCDLCLYTFKTTIRHKRICVNNNIKHKFPLKNRWEVQALVDWYHYRSASQSTQDAEKNIQIWIKFFFFFLSAFIWMFCCSLAACFVSLLDSGVKEGLWVDIFWSRAIYRLIIVANNSPLHSRYVFIQFLHSLGIKPTTLSLLAPWTTMWTTRTLTWMTQSKGHWKKNVY